ncbi:hypothetical protein XENOCAPTIV_014436, partial [Xenoophorus captivus]
KIPGCSFTATPPGTLLPAPSAVSMLCSVVPQHYPERAGSGREADGRPGRQEVTVFLFQDLKQPYQGQEHLGAVVESWPWFHIMDEAMQGRLFNSSLVLAILYELGLQGRLTTEQLAKKWDNLKRRYKELKFPSRGVDTNPSSWPWFYRMNDAMEGRLANAAPILAPIVEDGDEECEPLLQMPKKRARRSRGGMAEFLTESEMDLGIVKEMGLTGKITPDQVAKKWDNLKSKFKVCSPV